MVELIKILLEPTSYIKLKSNLVDRKANFYSLFDDLFLPQILALFPPLSSLPPVIPSHPTSFSPQSTSNPPTSSRSPPPPSFPLPSSPTPTPPSPPPLSSLTPHFSSDFNSYSLPFHHSSESESYIFFIEQFLELLCKYIMIRGPQARLFILKNEVLRLIFEQFWEKRSKTTSIAIIKLFIMIWQQKDETLMKCISEKKYLNFLFRNYQKRSPDNLMSSLLIILFQLVRKQEKKDFIEEFVKKFKNKKGKKIKLIQFSISLRLLSYFYLN